MPNYCHVELIGHLTRDPELKYTQGGQGICTGAIAYSKSWKDKATGQKKEKVAFIDFKIWGQSGERFAEWYQKGTAVHVTGELEQDNWEDKTTGAKRSKLVLNVSDFRSMQQAPSGDRQQREPAMAAEESGDVPF